MTGWAPLCADQPVDGEPYAVHSYSRSLVRTAERIAAQVEVLRRLADPGEWQAETADAFRDQARDLADEIERAEGRYRTVGGLVSEWGEALDEARAAAAALRDDAQEQQRIVDANPEAGPEAPAPDAPPGTLPEMSPAGLAQNSRRDAALREIEDLRGRLARLLEGHEEKGSGIGQRIRGALDDDLNDRWQDRLKAWVAKHADTLKSIATWAGRIAAVVGLIALFISPLGWIAFAAAIVAVLASGALAMSGDGSWVDFGLNVLGAATFGLGAFMTRGVSAAFRGGRGLLAARASASTRSAILNAGDGPVTSLLGRLPVVGSAVRGTAAAARSARASAAGAYRYLAVRYAPLQAPTAAQTVAYNGRRVAAIRNEALVWVRGTDDLAALGQRVLHDGLISGTRYLPFVSVPGVALNTYGVGTTLASTVTRDR